MKRINTEMQNRKKINLKNYSTKTLDRQAYL